MDLRLLPQQQLAISAPSARSWWSPAPAPRFSGCSTKTTWNQ